MNEPESEKGLPFAEDRTGEDALTTSFVCRLLSEFAED